MKGAEMPNVIATSQQVFSFVRMRFPSPMISISLVVHIHDCIFLGILKRYIGDSKRIASDTKEPESEVAFAFIVIRLDSKHFRSQ
jgi:hypothetical protein